MNTMHTIQTNNTSHTDRGPVIARCDVTPLVSPAFTTIATPLDIHDRRIRAMRARRASGITPTTAAQAGRRRAWRRRAR